MLNVPIHRRTGAEAAVTAQRYVDVDPRFWITKELGGSNGTRPHGLGLVQASCSSTPSFCLDRAGLHRWKCHLGLCERSDFGGSQSLVMPHGDLVHGTVRRL